MRVTILLILLILLTLTSFAHAQSVRIVEAFPHLSFQRPILLTHFGDPGKGKDRIVVAQQDGRVFWFENDPTLFAVRELIDISKRVGRASNEEGLLGVTFAPAITNSRHLYLHYTLAPQKKNILARYTLDKDLTRAAPASEQVILTVDQPYNNHNGGDIHFGPDGMLYISLGDGGLRDDPQNNAQNLSNLLGKILRIDVSRAQPPLDYAIPPDNPFVENANARPEIWAYGLRNVWRMSFDRATGVLYAGDVGQDKWEEIDVITKGGNFGWSAHEGTHPWKADRAREDETYIPPIAEHDHAQAKSITGGYVYRGERIPSLVGRYVYGDFETGLIWSLTYDPATGKATTPQFLGHVPQVAGFGEDRDGEVYVCSLAGKIYRIEPAK